MAMSSKQETDTSISLPEHYKAGWKSRLHRFQSSLRRSFRPKKVSRSTVEDSDRRHEHTKDKERYLLNRSSFTRDRDVDMRREYLSLKNHGRVSTKRDNGTKTTSHDNYVNGKTLSDGCSLDKRKFEPSKTICNNNFRAKENCLARSSNAHSTELAGLDQDTSNKKKRLQKVKLQRANVNTQRTSISKSKSLSILTNLFRRSNLSKNKDNRGKGLSNVTSQTAALQTFMSTTVSTDFDTLVTSDPVLSSSSIDSFPDSDHHLKRDHKYYSLKRSKAALIFPKNNLARAISLDTSLDPENRLMEKSRTLAAIPPCIRVEEFRDNCGFLERSMTAEFIHESSGSVTIDAGTEFYHRLTTCSTPVISLQQSEVDLNSSGDRESYDIKISSDSVPDITQEIEKSNQHGKKQAVYSSLSFSTDKTFNGDIGSPGFIQGEQDIAAEKTHSQFAVESCKGQSESSDDRSSPTSQPKDFVDFKPDMGNNASYVQKSGKLLPGKATLNRPKKKHGRNWNEDCSDGEDEPIIIEENFLECFEREFRDQEFNDRFLHRNNACSCNGLTELKSSPLYVVDESVINNSPKESSDVKPEIGENVEKHNREELDDDKKCTCDHPKCLSNAKVNNLQETWGEHFCSSTHGQTDRNELLSTSDCLQSTKTRQELTDSTLMECSLELSKKANLGSDHVNDKLINGGFPEFGNADQGLTEKGLQSPKVNSFLRSPFASSTPAQAMHSSYPDIATMHLSPALYESNEISCSSQQLESSLEESSSGFDSSEQKTQPSLSLDLSKCKSNGKIVRSHLSPELAEERMRSCSTRIPFRSPLHQVLLTENRSASCTQLDKKDEENAICSSPPYVRPRIQSLEELPPCTAEVVLRKKRNILKKNRLKHTASLPVVDHIFDDLIDKGKRHSYGGFGDGLVLQLPHLLQRSLSAEGQLDSCSSSVQSINSSSSFTESELGSTLSVISDLSGTGAFDKSLGRSRSVPGHLGIADISQASPIPEEQSSVAETELVSNSIEDSVGYNEDNDDDDNDGNICEMDTPEAFAEALWDHVTMDPEELSFQVGDIITVLAMTSCDWWFGQVKDRVGWFPAPFVRVRVSQTLAADETKLAPPVRTRKGTNEGFLSDAVVRSRVVEEIVNTERDYVKNLRDVVEGYLKQARRRTDMFTEEQIATIFSNIEQIYHFHQEILKQLEACFVKEDPCGSDIGAVFLENKHGFEIYSEYCNNHPHAMAELRTLCESNKYKQFFEACRLLQQMISISLDGFLLTPVQKICKYPLQLAELKKHTKPNHRDFQAVKQALDTMKEVASLINERKRKVESIHKIAKWQSIIEGWEGEDLLDRSSELIHSGDVIKISNGISQDRVMFLFDHQLVLCKKDILKKNGLTYKGRIFVDDCTVREENQEKSTLHHTWKIYNRKKERWYIFYTKKADDKELWLSAFQEERRRVSEDARTGLIISQKTRKAAMRAAQTSAKQKKVNGKKDKLQKSQSTAEIKPSSPTLQLPEPVSSADLREINGEEKDSLDPRSSVTRRSFGLVGSKKSKEKRMSSVL